MSQPYTDYRRNRSGDARYMRPTGMPMTITGWSG